MEVGKGYKTPLLSLKAAWVLPLLTLLHACMPADAADKSELVEEYDVETNRIISKYADVGASCLTGIPLSKLSPP